MGRLAGRAAHLPALGEPRFAGLQAPVHTELRQNRVRRNAALAPETLVLLEAACSGPMETWVENLRVFNISCDVDGQGPQRFQTANDDVVQQQRNALLSTGVGGRDDSPLAAGCADIRPTEHVRTYEDLPAAAPFDEQVREVLPFLAAAQRADPFFGPVIAYLELAGTDQAAAWMRTPVPLAEPNEASATAPMRTTTLLDISSACFRDDEGIPRRFRLRT